MEEVDESIAEKNSFQPETCHLTLPCVIEMFGRLYQKDIYYAND